MIRVQAERQLQRSGAPRVCEAGIALQAEAHIRERDAILGHCRPDIHRGAWEEVDVIVADSAAGAAGVAASRPLATDGEVDAREHGALLHRAASRRNRRSRARVRLNEIGAGSGFLRRGLGKTSEAAPADAALALGAEGARHVGHVGHYRIPIVCGDADINAGDGVGRKHACVVRVSVPAVCLVTPAGRASCGQQGGGHACDADHGHQPGESE